MGSLDLDSLFTNMPFDTTDIWANTLFENAKKVEGLSKIDFKSCYKKILFYF